MLRNKHVPPPSMRLNLQRPKTLLTQFLNQSLPRQIFAFDAEGMVYFDRCPDPSFSIDRHHSANWPLDTEMAKLESDLQLRDAVFPRYVELVRYGYLARHFHDNGLENALIHIDGDKALDLFSIGSQAPFDVQPDWIIFENISDAPMSIEGFNLYFRSTDNDAVIFGKNDCTYQLDLEILCIGYERQKSDIVVERSRYEKLERNKILSYKILRDIHKEDSTFLQRTGQISALAFIYAFAWTIGAFAPKRRDKLLRSAHKRDPRIIDHRQINKLIRNYPERLKLQQRVLESITAENKLSGKTSFSILIDLSKPETTHILRDFLNQSYTGSVQIILCVTDKSDAPDLSFMKDDAPEIVFLPKNDHGNQDQWVTDGVSHATGTFIILANAGYRYDPQLLSAIDQAVCEGADISIIYADEDEAVSPQERARPRYKPDWNKDLFYSSDYFGQPVFIRSNLFKSIVRKGVNDPNLIAYGSALKIIEQGEEYTIQHLDLILSTRQSHTQINLHESQRHDLLKAHFECMSLQDVRLLHSEHDPTEHDLHLIWPTGGDSAPLVSLIMPTHNQLHLTRTAVTSILERSRYQNYELLIIDNNSDDPDMLAWLTALPSHDPRIRVLRDPRPFNFSAINNAAFCHATGEVIGLVNNDIEIISHEWLDEMVGQALRPDIGCVGAKLLYPSGEIQHAGVNIDLVGDTHHLMRMCPGSASGYMDRLRFQQNYLAVTGACLFLKRSIFASVGGLNQIDLPIGYSDLDLCLKAQALRLRNIWSPRAILFHYESISRGLDITKEKRYRAAQEHAFMKQRWDMVDQSDPYFNSAIAFSDNLCGISGR